MWAAWYDFGTNKRLDVTLVELKRFNGNIELREDR